MKKRVIFPIVLLLSACSNRAIYENIQIHNRNECLKEPPPLYEECMRRASKTYDEYLREQRQNRQGRNSE